MSAAVFEVPERPSDRSRPDYRHHPGYHLSRHPRSYCRARKGLAQPKTRVRAIAYPCSAWVELLRLVAPAQRPQNSTRYVPVAVAFTFGFEGKNGIGTDTDAGGIVLMGARLYDPNTGRFLQVDPDFGGSCNPYDYTCQDPVNATDLNGQEPDVEGGMTDAEIAWCLAPSRWRLCADAAITSKVARDWTTMVFGDRNGRSYADAFLHIVWMAWLSYFDGENTALGFGERHEDFPGNSGRTMALINNQLGASIGQAAADEGYTGQTLANFIFNAAIETACTSADVPEKDGYPHQSEVCASYGY